MGIVPCCYEKDNSSTSVAIVSAADEEQTTTLVTQQQLLADTPIKKTSVDETRTELQDSSVEEAERVDEVVAETKAERAESPIQLKIATEDEKEDLVVLTSALVQQAAASLVMEAFRRADSAPEDTSAKVPIAAADVAARSRAVITYKDGSKYEGQVCRGKRHGRGIWKWTDGRVYTGQFINGKFHGHGKMEWNKLWNEDGGVWCYEGQYVSDLKHGRGRFEWPDGRIYEGEWSNGQRSGSGVYTNMKGESREGTWKDDKLQAWSKI